MNVLHLIQDEKFVQHVQNVSRAANPGRNRFRIGCAEGVTPRFATSADDTAWGPGYFEDRRQMDADLAWCDVLVVHLMTAEAAKVVRAARRQSVVIWSCWGFDYYGFAPEFRDRLYLPLSLKMAGVSWRKRAAYRMKSTAAFAALRAMTGRCGAPGWMSDIAPRIDFYCILEAHLRLDRALPGFRAVPLPYFGYYSVEQTFEPGPAQMQGPDVLLGNSATLTNNHADALELLRKIDLGSGRIVMPLSYGHRELADAVDERARGLFGARAVALRDWMSLEDYNRTISSCGTVIMNHTRGQAMGNIGVALFKGAKVFLRSANPYYRYFRDAGAHVSAIDQRHDVRALLEPLSDAERRDNVEAMRRQFSFEAGVRRVRSILNAASGT